MIISLIVAMDTKGGIGKKNRLPWYLPSDLKRFKAITMGHHLIMGRKTYETIGRALPGRTMVIVTRNVKYHPEGCVAINSIEEAINLAKNNGESEVFIIGGSNVFRQTIDLADRLYLTEIHADTGADVFFPSINTSEWRLIKHEKVTADDKDDFSSDFKIFERLSKQK